MHINATKAINIGELKYMYITCQVPVHFEDKINDDSRQPDNILEELLKISHNHTVNTIQNYSTCPIKYSESASSLSVVLQVYKYM